MGNGAQKQVLDELSGSIQRGDAAQVNAFLQRVSLAKRPNARKDKDSEALKALDLNAEAFNGATPLQLAAMCKQPAIVRQLLDFTSEDQYLTNIDCNAMDSNKRTALHCAAGNPPIAAPACAQCVADLLHRKANPCIANSDGMTPLDAARRARCKICVRTLEDNVKIWQGWVDHDERGFLGLPNWQPRWLVVLRDRYPNTGIGATWGQVKLTCYSCNYMLKAPGYCFEVQCTRCNAKVGVTPSLQVALYASQAATPQVLPDSAVPVLTLGVPQMPSLVSATAQEQATWTNAGQALFAGNIRKALQSSQGTQRTFGLTLSLSGQQATPVEHSFRVDSAADRDALLVIFAHPVKAAYEAERQSDLADVAGGAHEMPATAPNLAPAFSPQATMSPPAIPEVAPLASQAFMAMAEPSEPSEAPPPQDTLPPTMSDSNQPSNIPADGQEETCVICMAKMADTAIVPCGHLCACWECLQSVERSRNQQCPVCRGPVTSLLRIFKAAP